MNYISWTITTLAQPFGQLAQNTASLLSTHGITSSWLASDEKRPFSITQQVAVALGLVGIGFYTAPRIARWFYSFRTPERLMKSDERRLTQGTLIPPTPSDSPEMHKNYQTGIKLLKYAKKAILFSPNYLYRSETYRNKCTDPQSARVLARAINKIFLKVDEQLKKEGLGDRLKLTFKEIEIFAKYAVKYNVANCHGTCCACMVYAKNKKINQRIEMFQIANHVFLVIGRNNKSLPLRYYSMWGRDTIVCDTWAQSCYPASEMNTHLMDLSRVIEHPLSGEQYTIVKPLSSFLMLIGELDPTQPSENEFPLLHSPSSSSSSTSQEPSQTGNQNPLNH